MALSNSQYDSILRHYEDTRTANRHILEARKQEIFEKLPRYATICDTIASVSIEQGEKLIFGDDSALDTLKDILADLRAQKTKILTDAGYPADYLEPIYTCQDCKDTGYIGTQKCHCFKQVIISFLYDQSHIRELLKTENFQALSDAYYKGEDLQRFHIAEKEARLFVENFKTDYHNLFFYGTVGTGKSFLSACIAKELLDAGYSVLYFSSAALFDQIAHNTFHKNDSSDLVGSDITTCDLLIIDDLGTEYMNQFVATSLFSCLNSRHLAKKATIISTNLSLEELRDRYSDRVFSRITSHFNLCKLTGADIRIQKKVDRK